MLVDGGEELSNIIASLSSKMKLFGASLRIESWRLSLLSSLDATIAYAYNRAEC
jgi:hypothetical protein